MDGLYPDIHQLVHQASSKVLKLYHLISYQPISTIKNHSWTKHEAFVTVVSSQEPLAPSISQNITITSYQPRLDEHHKYQYHIVKSLYYSNNYIIYIQASASVRWSTMNSHTWWTPLPRPGGAGESSHCAAVLAAVGSSPGGRLATGGVGWVSSVPSNWLIPSWLAG